MHKKSLLLCGVVVGLALVSFTTASAASLTATQVQAVVSLLQSFNVSPAIVAQVQAQLGGSTAGVSTPSSSSSCLTLTSNLALGATDARSGGQVSSLQAFLGVAPATGYFGPLTQQAVQQWQSLHGVVSSGSPSATGYGAVGPKTRAALACQSTPAPAPSSANGSSSGVTPTGSSGGGGGGGGGGGVSTSGGPSSSGGVSGGSGSSGGGTSTSSSSGDSSSSQSQSSGSSGSSQSTTPPAPTPPAPQPVPVPSVSGASPNSGLPGSTVTIQGANFTTAGNTVLLNGSSVATLGSSNGTSLSFSIPSGQAAATYTLAVQNANGTSGSVALTVTSPPPPAPTVLTLTSGGSITDASGSTWSFTSTKSTVDSCGDYNYTMNGTWQHNEAATYLTIYQGLLHQYSCMYGWYHYDPTNVNFFSQDSSTDAAALNAIVASAGSSGTQAVAVPPPSNPAPSGFTPPGSAVSIAACNGNAAHDTSAITAAIAAAGAGNTAKFAAGTSYSCTFNSFTVSSGVYLYADPSASVTLTAASPGGAAGSGNQITLASNATFNGSYAVQTCNAIFNLASASNPALGNINIGKSGCGYDRVQLDGSSGAVIENNNISYCGQASPSGSGCIAGGSPTGVTIDGNHIAYNYNTGNDFINMPGGAGANSAITRNVFQHFTDAVMEIGYAATTQATTNLHVQYNWANLSDGGGANGCLRGGFSICLIISLPLNGTGSTGTLVDSNYADGTTQTHSGTTAGDIFIELQGSGTVSNNKGNNFRFGSITSYSCAPSPGVSFTNNDFSNAGTSILNYANCGNVSLSPNPQSSASFSAPSQPTRLSWGGQN